MMAQQVKVPSVCPSLSVSPRTHIRVEDEPGVLKVLTGHLCGMRLLCSALRAHTHTYTIILDFKNSNSVGLKTDLEMGIQDPVFPNSWLHSQNSAHMFSSDSMTT